MKRWIFKSGLTLVLTLLMSVFLGVKAANVPENTANNQKEAPGERPDVRKIIFEHIGDSYTWHITTIGHTEIAIPLPVLVYSPETGVQAFFASKLHEGHHYKGFFIEESGKYAGKIVREDASGKVVRPLDLSVTKNVLALMISVLILLILVLTTARWYKKHPLQAPGGFIGMIEAIIVFLMEDVVKSNVGPEYKRYQSYLITVFFFILINNLIGLIPIFPFGANVTGNIAITFILAMFTMVIVNFSGTKEYWKEIFWPEIPLFLKLPIPLMPIVEVFGVISKPFSLMIRLFANIMAGHTIMISLVSLVFFTVTMGTVVNSVMSTFSVVLSVFMFLVEILVAFIQAYIFTILSSVYIGLARVKHHK